MPNGTVDFSEILLSSIPDMIQNIAQAVAEAQSRLDIAAIKTQQNIGTQYPDLAKIGYHVNWYQMPEVTFELKVAMHYESMGNDSVTPNAIFISPYNAKYKSTFNYSADGSSIVKFRIVPVPPPVVSEPT